MTKKAVFNWTKKEGNYFDSDGNPRILNIFAPYLEIPPKTFRNCMTIQNSNRRVVGSSVGRKLNLTQSDKKFIISVLVRIDRGNEGKNRMEVIVIVQEINPNLSRV